MMADTSRLEMEEDMREHYENEFDGEAKLGNTDAQDKRKFFFDSLTSEVSLQEHLLDQLKLTEINQKINLTLTFYRYRFSDKIPICFCLSR